MAETLRILTYMCPSHPVELYKTIVEYLESKLNKPCELLYEWRGSGPESGVPDPFKSTSAGIAFISSFSFQHLSATDDPDWTLLPVGAVCQHPKKGDGLGYWSDLIISSADKERIKELIDLRGCRLARPEVSSLSGYIALLKAVRDQGESAAFFGNVLDSGSHLASVEMVSLKQAELAAVDSLALQNALDQHPAMRSEIHILDTLGPLPPYPIVVRSTMDAYLRQQIEKALLDMDKDKKWADKFAKYHVLRYETIDSQVFEIDKEMRKLVANMTTGARYY